MTSQNDKGLELEANGDMLRFPAVWLRDNCPCAECVDPVTGQKLKDITDIPNGLAVTAAEDTGASVVVTFAPDQHRSVFVRSWLAAHALDTDDDRDERTEDGKELWLPAGLDAVLRRGFVLLRDVPAEPGLVLQVAASFGFVRPAPAGRLGRPGRPG